MNEKVLVGPKFGTLINRKWITIFSELLQEGFPVLQSYNQNKWDRWKIPLNHCK
jgi:hypothetical protein